MPNRILREGILTSERVNTLAPPAEVFYRRLHSVVDDFGRYYAKPELLRAACYPLKLDKVGNSDIGKWIGEAREAALVRTYTVAGKEYLELLDFRQQVRAKESKFPEPPSICVSDAQQMQSNAHLDVDVDVVRIRKRKPHAKTALPENFAISDRVHNWSEKQGYFNLQAHFDSFVSKCLAKGYAYVDWDEALMGAVRDDWAKLGKGAPVEKRVALG